MHFGVKLCFPAFFFFFQVGGENFPCSCWVLGDVYNAIHRID